MADEKTPEQIAAEQAAADAQAALDAAKGTGSVSGGKTVEELQAELTRTAAALSTANSEAATNRRELKKFREAEEARQQAAMSDLEKERKRADDAEAREKSALEQAKTTALKAAFETAAYKAGVAHPEDVYLLADKGAVNIGDDGKISGVDEAVKALVAAGRVPMSNRQTAPSLDGGAGGNGDRSAGVRLTADEIETAKLMNITPEKYAANKAALAAQAAGEDPSVIAARERAEREKAALAH